MYVDSTMMKPIELWHKLVKKNKTSACASVNTEQDESDFGDCGFYVHWKKMKNVKEENMEGHCLGATTTETATISNLSSGTA